jgi:hypothetical protein
MHSRYPKIRQHRLKGHGDINAPGFKTRCGSNSNRGTARFGSIRTFGIINPQTVVRKASSLSDLKEIGCKSVWLVYISPLSTHKGQ